VFVKKSYLSSWVFTHMQSVHIRMNLSLGPPLKEILDPPMYVHLILSLESFPSQWRRTLQLQQFMLLACQDSGRAH